MIDDRELEPLRAVQRHHPDARVPGALLPRRRPRAATADRRSRRATARARGSRTRARPRRAPRGSRCGSRRPRCAPRAGPGGSRSGRAPCRARSTPTRARAISVSATIRSRNAASDAAARGASRPLVDRADEPRPERVRRRRRLQARPRAAAAASVDRAGIDRLERVHHALADAARRHVDHAPQADVVVRVDDQPACTPARP